MELIQAFQKYHAMEIMIKGYMRHEDLVARLYTHDALFVDIRYAQIVIKVLQRANTCYHFDDRFFFFY